MTEVGDRERLLALGRSRLELFKQALARNASVSATRSADIASAVAPAMTAFAPEQPLEFKHDNPPHPLQQQAVPLRSNQDEDPDSEFVSAMAPLPPPTFDTARRPDLLPPLPPTSGTQDSQGEEEAQSKADDSSLDADSYPTEDSLKLHAAQTMLRQSLLDAEEDQNMTSLAQEVAQLREERQRLRQDLLVLRQQLDAQGTRCSQLQQDNTSLVEEMDLLEQECESANKQLSELRRNLHEQQQIHHQTQQHLQQQQQLQHAHQQQKQPPPEPQQPPNQQTQGLAAPAGAAELFEQLLTSMEDQMELSRLVQGRADQITSLLDAEGNEDAAEPQDGEVHSGGPSWRSFEVLSSAADLAIYSRRQLKLEEKHMLLLRELLMGSTPQPSSTRLQTGVQADPDSMSSLRTKLQMYEEHNASLAKDKIILAGRIRQVVEEKDLLLQSLRTNLDLATQAHHEETTKLREELARLQQATLQLQALLARTERPSSPAPEADTIDLA